MNPYISIIVPTFRPGGLDVLFSGLKNQVFKNFELILVDMIAKYRSPIIRDLITGVNWGFNIKYVEPLDNTFPFASYAHMFNTGLVHADGEIILITGDYIWFPPECLQKHADFHLNNPKSGYMAPHTYFETPELVKLPQWKKAEIQSADTPSRSLIKYTYVDDLESGKYNDAMWSTFKNPILDDPRTTLLPSREWSTVDPKFSMSNGWSDYRYVHFKNESFPLESALDINGCDEDFNGAHSYQDTEFAQRLTVWGEINWYLDASNSVYGFSLKDDELPRLRRLRPYSGNRLMIELKRIVAYRNDFSPTDPNLASDYSGRDCNDWSIRDYRNKDGHKNIVKTMNFRGVDYKITCFEHTKWHGSWFSFTDELDMRNTYWNVKPGDVVLDVGAAYGAYTFPAILSGAAYVFAWSPPQQPPGDESEHITFKKSLELNGWSDRCTVYNYGLYNKDGWLRTTTQEFIEAISESHEYDFTLIRVITLDSWAESVSLQKVDWMKVDVELAECEVLRGAKNLINKFHPKILIENHIDRRQSVEQEVRDILTSGELGVKYKEIETRVHNSVSLSFYIPE